MLLFSELRSLYLYNKDSYLIGSSEITYVGHLAACDIYDDYQDTREWARNGGIELEGAIWKEDAGGG